MSLFRQAERLMSMTDESWARHANPLSVYSRFSTLPLLVLAIWSRAWLGWWALVPVALAVGWIWLNPRLFARPARTDNWASKGTFGERVYLNQATIPIPRHYTVWGRFLSAVSGLGTIPLAWGLYAFDPGWVCFGAALIVGAKTWLVDRMVFLYDEMREASPIYASWLR